MKRYEQDRVVTRLQQRVQREPAVMACFLTGSYGRREADDYSDLDVVLVYTSEAARDLAYGRREEFAADIMSYVPVKTYDADHQRPYLHVALYANGTKVDFRYETQDELEPSHLDREIYILKDSNDWAAQFQHRTTRTPMPPPPHISPQQLADLDDRFWIMFWDVFRQVQRGDHDKPFGTYLELVHMTLPVLLYLLPDRPDLRARIIDLQYSPDTKRTIGHLRDLLEVYVEARTAVVNQYRLAFEADTGFEQAIRKLAKKR